MSAPASVREALLSFIRAVQAAPQNESSLHDLSQQIFTETGQNGVAKLTLSFGFGYFDPSKVLVYLDDRVVGEAETEEAVSAYCEGRIPEVIKKG